MLDQLFNKVNMKYLKTDVLHIYLAEPLLCYVLFVRPELQYN